MFVLLPATDKLGWKYLPFGVIFLSLVYLINFFAFQLEDYHYNAKSIKYYFQNGLDKIEFPLYVRFVRKNMRNDIYMRNLEKIANNEVTKMEFYWMQRSDPFFQACLENEKCIATDNLSYLKWLDNKREYLRLLEKSGLQSFGFKSADATYWNVLSAPFIHSNFIEFIINFLILVAIGALLESKIGAIGIMGGYVIGGIIMVSIYSILAPYNLIPLAASSGAIAYLVGLEVVLYGFERVKYFYFNGRKIKYFLSRGMQFCLIWLLCIALYVYFNAFDWVDGVSLFAAFSGGVMSGILLKRVILSYQYNRGLLGKHTELQKRLNEAVNEITHFNYGDAKKILHSLLKEYPSNREIYIQLFNIAKNNPASEEYHQISHKIFSLKDSSKSTVAMINLVFKNYVRRAQPTIRFDVEIFLGLLQRFRKTGYYDDSEKILKVLIKHNDGDALSEILAREQLLLARACLMKNDIVHGNRLLEWLLTTFPHTESAKQAKTFLNYKDLDR